MSEGTPWFQKAACTGKPPGWWFSPVQSTEYQIAKGICSACPVTAQCLADAQAGKVEAGVWGGELAPRARAEYERSRSPERLARERERYKQGKMYIRVRERVNA